MEMATLKRFLHIEISGCSPAAYFGPLLIYNKLSNVSFINITWMPSHIGIPYWVPKRVRVKNSRNFPLIFGKLLPNVLLHFRSSALEFWNLPFHHVQNLIQGCLVDKTKKGSVIGLFSCPDKLHPQTWLFLEELHNDDNSFKWQAGKSTQRARSIISNFWEEIKEEGSREEE